MSREIKMYRSQNSNRKGVVSLEMAVTIPVVMLLFLGAIEFSRVVMLRHTLDNAAYEAARVGVVPGATSQMVRDRATKVLRLVRAQDYTIQVFPEEITDETDQLSVLIQVPMASNGYGVSKFFPNALLAAKCTKPRLTIAAVVPSAIPVTVSEAETSSGSSSSGNADNNGNSSGGGSPSDSTSDTSTAPTDSDAGAS